MTTASTTFMRAIGIDHPLIQAPMGGANVTPPELVAAVSNAGGLGFIGAAYMTPAQIDETCAGVRAGSGRPFGINLFAPLPAAPMPNDTALAVEQVARAHAELELPPPGLFALTGRNTGRFDEQLAAVLASGARVFSFTFGLLPEAVIQAIKARGMYVIGTATTVEEAIALESSGVDAVVAQGSEAGAHRGSFAVPFEEAMIGTIALVPQVVDAVRVPVIAAGGIMDGRGVAAALVLGASAVQMGTAFLVSDECGIPDAYKAAVLGAREHETRVTRAFSGRPARGIVNRFMTDVENAGADAILPYPHQNALTRPMRTAAAEQNRPEFLSLWAGQGVRLARRRPAGAIVQDIMAEIPDSLGRARIGQDEISAPSNRANLTFRELLDYTAVETDRWHRWLAASREGLLDLPAGEGRTATVRGLLQHIFAVERRYADRLLGEPVTAYDSIPTHSVESLFAAGREARAMLERYLGTATDTDLAKRLEFQTISAGTLTASARKVIAHTLLHGMRHWAQLATVFRQNGHAADWMHDLLVSEAVT